MPRTRSPACSSTRTRGDPTKWLVDFDLNRPAFNDTRVQELHRARHVAGVAAQQVQLHELGAVQLGNRTGGGSATRTPEAQGLNLYTPGHTRTLTWTSPFTNRVLFEAGWGSYLANYANDAPRIDGQHNPRADLGPRTGHRRRQRRHRRT